MVKTKKQKSVSVTLEKAEEDISLKTHVPLDIIASIKPRDQMEEDAVREQAEIKKGVFVGQLKTRLLFYGGILASVASLFLLCRFFKVKPQAKFVPEIINGAAQLAV